MRTPYRKRLPKGLVTALGTLRREIRVYLKHRRGLRRARVYAGQNGLKLNIGCGRKTKTGWVNVDLSPEANVTVDLREPLPFSDGSCTFIYSEHFLEHLEYPYQVRAFLQEARRLLIPGGTLSVGVPDTAWPLEDYVHPSDSGWLATVDKRWFPDWCQTPMDFLNWHFRQGSEHRFAYDELTLSHLLQGAGFTEVRRRGYDPDLDSPDRAIGTLYMDANQPTKA